MGALTYTFDDVVAALNSVLEHDWATSFASASTRRARTAARWRARGGYRLVFKEGRSEFQREAGGLRAQRRLRLFARLSFGENGNVTAVQWDGPAFNQGVTVGTQVVAIDGVCTATERSPRVTAAKTERAPIELLAARWRSVSNRHDRVSRRVALSAPRARHGDGRPLDCDSRTAFTLTSGAQVLDSRVSSIGPLVC